MAINGGGMMLDLILENKLKNSPLVYRNILSIPRGVRFGLELELDRVDFNEVYRIVRRQFGTRFQVKEDASLTKTKNAEIATNVLNNTKETWLILKKLGELLKKFGANYDNCSFQVNFDGRLLPNTEDRVRFLKLYAMYEDIIYRFSMGEDSDYRDSLENYAAPIILTLKGVSHFDDDGIIEMFSNNKRYGVVFKTDGKDLVEFRTPNMTDNPILWQNYITTFYYLLRFATSNKYDKREVDKYIDDFCKIYVLENYALEKKEKAYQFSKKIFLNSTDRINFMSQYLGNGMR